MSGRSGEEVAALLREIDRYGCESFHGQRRCSDPGSGRVRGSDEGATAWCHPCLAHMALSALLGNVDSDEQTGACRYCGILPGQDLPRPSYHDMRLRYTEALRLLSVPISEMDTAYGAECDAFLSRALGEQL